MITSIARQSVIIKCNAQKSTLLGNYEFYYGAGLLNRLYGVGAEGTMEPQALMEHLQNCFSQMNPRDEREKYLIRLVENYDPSPDYDDQMKELFAWGESEKDMWLLQTTNHPDRREKE